MANEITVQYNANIRNGTFLYQTKGGSFRLNQTNVGGISPGQITVPTTGIDVDLSELTTPGFCEMTNLDDTYWVEGGVHDGSIFHPVFYLPPGGKTFPIYLSPNLGVEEDVPGTGTSAVVNTLFLRGVGGTCKVVVAAMEA